MDKDNIFSLENSGCFEDSLTHLLNRRGCNRDRHFDK